MGGGNVTNNPEDRFGMPDSAYKAARESHGVNNPLFRTGMYVPTRHEVATLKPEVLLEILDMWFAESPSELIPSAVQIRDVRAVLLARPDSDTPGVQAVIELCDYWSTPPAVYDEAD